MRLATLFCVLTLTAAMGWFSRGWLGDGTAPPAGTEAATARVARARMEQTVKARGIVKPSPNALVRVGFPMPKDVARRIGRMTVAEGDVVRVGEELARLEHDDLTATLEQLTAEVAVIESRLGALRTLEPLEIRIAEAVRDQTRSQLDFASRIHDRQAKLSRGTAASAQDFETAINDRAVAQAKYEQALANLEQVKARLQTEKTTLEAQVRQARAAAQNAEVQIRWSTLHAPIGGLVFAIHQQQGELTSNLPTAPVLTLLDPRQLQVYLYVDEADFGRIQVGQPVRFRVDAHPDQCLQGRIMRILPRPFLQENVVYYLAVVAPAADQRNLLRTEMTALAFVEADVNEQALSVPLAAVRSRSDGWYVVRPGRAGGVETPVRIGWKTEGRVEIREGLAEGDEVLLPP